MRGGGLLTGSLPTPAEASRSSSTGLAETGSEVKSRERAIGCTLSSSLPRELMSRRYLKVEVEGMDAWNAGGTQKRKHRASLWAI